MRFSQIKYLTHSPLPRVVKLKDGVLSFVCTCGSPAQVPLKNFTHLSRCQKCEEANKMLPVVWLLENTEELFEEMYELAFKNYLAEEGARYE